jgi:hypothetical protein
VPAIVIAVEMIPLAGVTDSSMAGGNGASGGAVTLPQPASRTSDASNNSRSTPHHIVGIAESKTPTATRAGDTMRAWGQYRAGNASR